MNGLRRIELWLYNELVLFFPARDVLKGVSWTRALDDVFRKNYEADPTLTWQYFGGAKGYFRIYPGMIQIIYRSTFSTPSYAIFDDPCTFSHADDF